MTEEMAGALARGTIAVMRGGERANRVIQWTFGEHPEWSGEARGRFSDVLYDMVRWWRYLWHARGVKPSFSRGKIDDLIVTYGNLLNEMPDGRAGGGLAAGERPGQGGTVATPVRAVAESVPDWLDETGAEELGIRWADVLRVLNERPRIGIRINTLKTDVDAMENALGERGIICERVEWAPEALILTEYADVFALPEFRDGLLTVQDPASQIVCRLLDPGPGDYVVDACAGQGGKTLHLCALTGNRGSIIALDTEEWKLEELRKRARRAGCHNVRTRLVTGTKDYKRMKGKAHRVLLDVPCSGLGRLRRNPDIRWKLSREDLERLRGLQADILDRYCMLTRSGGRLAYASCSVLPSEGEGQISRFLEEHSEDFELVKERRMWPDETGFDGFYIGILERK